MALYRPIACLHLLFLAIAASSAAAQGPSAGPAFEFNRQLGRGINFGNALEAPKEGEWGMRLEEQYFDAVKRAGFDSVRIPIRWSAHAAKSAPYTIDPQFFERVDWAIEQATKRDLTTVINIHHYDEIFREPQAHRERFLALWKQIAERYKDAPDRVAFELLNEPHNQLTPELWNEFARDALAAVRKTNPRRMVIIGPGQWNQIQQLDKLELPTDDRNVIVTVHYYLPFDFTHQGAEWQAEPPPVGRKWTGSDAEQKEVREHFDTAAQWAKKHNRPIYLGEFGAFNKADMESRARWTSFIRSEAEKRGFSWAYWEFGAGFGAYDRESGEWLTPLLSALVQ